MTTRPNSLSDERIAEIQALRVAMCGGAFGLHDAVQAIDDLLLEVKGTRTVPDSVVCGEGT